MTIIGGLVLFFVIAIVALWDLRSSERQYKRAKDRLDVEEAAKAERNIRQRLEWLRQRRALVKQRHAESKEIHRWNKLTQEEQMAESERWVLTCGIDGTYHMAPDVKWWASLSAEERRVQKFRKEVRQRMYGEKYPLLVIASD
jgi:hypothetical protein